MESFWCKRRKRRKNEIREIWEKKKQEHNKRLISNRIIRDIRTVLEQEDEDYLKPKRINSFWNNDYIEYESSDDKS